MTYGHLIDIIWLGLGGYAKYNICYAVWIYPEAHSHTSVGVYPHKLLNTSRWYNHGLCYIANLTTSNGCHGTIITL